MSKDFTSVGSSLDKKLQLRHTPLTKKIDKMKKLGRLNTKKQLPEDSENAID